MSNDIQKLKQTILILKKENSDFQRYNGHLRLAISQVSESNDKLLYSLHEKYNYFGNLESQSKYIEKDIQNKLWNIENFDFNKKSLYQASNPFKSTSSGARLNQITSVKDTNPVDNKAIDQAISNSVQIEIMHNSLDETKSKNNNIERTNDKTDSLNLVKDDDLNKSIIASDSSKHNSNKSSSKLKSKHNSVNSSIDNSTKLYHDSNSSKTAESNSRYSQKSIKSLVLQSFSHDSADSIKKLKQKQNMLFETNQKLKTEMEMLLSKIGDTDLFIKFQKESESYLKALKELHNLESHINQTFDDETSIKEQESNSHPQTYKENNLPDNQNQLSSVFLTDVESKSKSEPHSDQIKENHNIDQKILKVERSSQTNDNIRARYIVKYFSKGTHQNYLQMQNNKISIRRASIAELTSEVEKYHSTLEQMLVKKTEIPTTLIQIQNVSVINITNQLSYEDKETETDEHIDFDFVISQIEENKKYTKDYLIFLNEKFNLQAIFDQKDIELKIAQSSSDHKTANYRSLLRNLKTTDPDSYAKFIGTVGMSSKDEQRRQRYMHQIDKFSQKIQKANVETKEIETKEKQVKLRIEMLERELAVFKNPKDHMKSALTDICQEIALDQEKIRDQMRELAFVKLESDFIDRIKTRIFKKTSKIDELSQKIKEMSSKLKKIKGRCRYSLRSGQYNYPITSPSELDNLQEAFDGIECEVNSLDEKIDIFSKKSISYFQQLAAYKLNIPPPLKTCQIIQSNLNNVL